MLKYYRRWMVMAGFLAMIVVAALHGMPHIMDAAKGKFNSFPTSPWED